MKERSVSFVQGLIIAAFLLASPAGARINGIASSSCNGCHGVTNSGLVSISGPSSIEPGDQVTLTITITNPGIQGGGFYLSNQQNEGTFSVISGEGTKLNSSGVGHSARKNAVGGSVTFNVNWTAPLTEGASRFTVAGVAANADGRSSGDQSGQGLFDVVYGCEGQTVYRDYDGDGYGTELVTSIDCGPSEFYSDKPGDCNENDANIHPGATEVCNLADDDCDGVTDEGLEDVIIYRDEDGDGHGVPTETAIGCGTRSGFAGTADDCNDADALIHPSAAELCNGRDDDCDQDADEELIATCGVGICVRSAESCFVSECIPGDPEPELCNGLDDDCNGTVDDGESCPTGQACIDTLCVTVTSLDGSGGGASFSDGGSLPPIDAAPTHPGTGGGGNTGQAGASNAGSATGSNGANGNEGGATSSGGCALAVNARSSSSAWVFFLLGVFLARRLRRGGYPVSKSNANARAVSMQAGAPRRRRAVHGLFWGALSVVAGVFGGCSGSGSPNPGETVCAPGETRDCTSVSGCTARESCNGAGTGYGACACVGGLGDGGVIPDATNDAASTGGSGDTDAAPPDGGCADVCDPQQPASCNDAVLQSCWRSPFDGCANALTSPCQRKKCGDENHCAVCIDECPSSGASGCRNGALGSCTRDAEGCLKWQRTEECASGFCADDASCGSCVHECETLGEVTCQDGLSRVCSENRHGCRSYSPWSECPVLQCASASQCLAGYSLGQRGTPLDDEAFAIAVDERGVVALVGAYHQFGMTQYNADSDAFLQARSADGALVKDTKWGSSADDSALAVSVDSQFHHLVTGWTAGKMDVNPHRGGRDAFLAKWGDDYNEPLWVRQWGTSANDVARALVVTESDDIFVVGSTGGQLGSEAPLGEDDIFVIKWDSAGNRLWIKQWGSAKADVPTAAALDSSGHLWIAGRTAGSLGPTGNLGDYDAFVAELDGEGTVLFTKQFGTASGDAAEGIALDAEGNLFVAGHTQSAFDGNPSTGGIDVFVTKLTPAGSPIWSKLWGTTSDDFAEDLALDPAGNAYVAVSSLGTAGPSCPPGQAWAVGWDSNGGSTLEQLWDSCGVDTARAIAAKRDREILVAGSSTGELAHENRGGKDIISITLQPN